MSKIRIGGIMQVGGLAEIGVMSMPGRPGTAGQILSALGREGINVPFIVQSVDVRGYDHVVFCIASSDVDRAQELLNDVQLLVDAERLIRRPNVAIVSIFGPDFRERPGIAGAMFAALGERDINILAISTSISTVSCVIDDDLLGDAVAAIRETFELP